MNKTLLFITFSLFLFSCSKKDSPAPNNIVDNSNIIGKWTAIADTLQIYDNGKLKEEDIASAQDEQATGWSYEFKTDGTNILRRQSDNSILETDTYKIKGNVITFYHPAQTIDGLSYEAYSQDANIKKLNATTLGIAFDDNNDPDRSYESIYFIKQ